MRRTPTGAARVTALLSSQGRRVLGQLQGQGLIRVEDSGPCVELLDRMALRRLAGGGRRAPS